MPLNHFNHLFHYGSGMGQACPSCFGHDTYITPQMIATQSQGQHYKSHIHSFTGQFSLNKSITHARFWMVGGN